MAIVPGHVAFKMACLVLFAAVMLSSPPQIEAAMACGTVTSMLAPCYEYVLGKAAVPSGNCCAGVKSLYHQASTTAARRTVCECLKSVTKTASRTTVANAKALPGKCRVYIPYQISPSINCNK
ncbi:non-specific lipid-transfer protein [Striga asiatica]|uniref:Non-specific lipid-transfer protein n=1 Tax=Striga asiatica TaxID=4170 RepID=A0A5A7RDV8_STRAF|nr:non-specific lipid-transfer protein [Striga asiatica]